MKGLARQPHRDDGDWKAIRVSVDGGRTLWYKGTTRKRARQHRWETIDTGEMLTEVMLILPKPEASQALPHLLDVRCEPDRRHPVISYGECHFRELIYPSTSRGNHCHSRVPSCAHKSSHN